MEIKFREFNPFDTWIWIEFENVPSPLETQYIEELLDSWFYLGKLGAYNAENLQVQEAGIDISYLNYDLDRAQNSLMSLMHNMGNLEYAKTWGRCWLDFGTSDLIALDILINAFKQLDQEYVPIKQLIIGGENEDWKVNNQSDSKFIDD
jgi:hypothetical protein